MGGLWHCVTKNQTHHYSHWKLLFIAGLPIIIIIIIIIERCDFPQLW